MNQTNLMKLSCHRNLLGLGLVVNLTFAGIPVVRGATVIQFGDYPDGTLVSAGNPYASVLNLQATGGTDYGIRNYQPPGGGWVAGTLWTESTISSGVLQVMSTGTLPPDGYVLRHRSQLSATFSQPVTEVSFDARCIRPAAYYYSGLDGAGAPFSGDGAVLGTYNGIPPGTYVTYAPVIPEGGFLTEFRITNNDDSAASGAFWIESISFTVIPEPGTISLLMLGIIGYALRRCGR